MKWGLAFLPLATIILLQCNHNENVQKNFNSKLISISKKDSSFYVNEGAKLAKIMYAEILKRLNKALDEEGFYESVKYCNLHAIQITDSLSKNYGIKAKRTSLKIRNPKNSPNSLEKQVLLMYEQTHSNKPVIYAFNDSIKFFTPIYIANLCLTCHGIPNQDIPDVTLATLNKFYPNDHATNYQLYDIRGIWSITFPKNYLSKLTNRSTN